MVHGQLMCDIQRSLLHPLVLFFFATTSIFVVSGRDERHDHVTGRKVETLLAPVIIKAGLVRVIGNQNVDIDGGKGALGPAHPALLKAAFDDLGDDHIRRTDMVGTHPAVRATRDRGDGTGGIKTVQVPATDAVVTADHRTVAQRGFPTLGAIQRMAVFREVEETGVVEERRLQFRLPSRWLSQPGQVGDVFVDPRPPVLDLPDADKVLLDLSWRRELGFAGPKLTLPDGCGVVDPDIASWTEPLSFGRLLRIQRGLQAFEVECIVAGIAAEELSNTVADRAVVEVFRGFPVVQINMSAFT